MNLNSLIISTLAPTEIPVAFLKYIGGATTYITFFEYNQQGKLFADDVEQHTRHSLQVDIWSKGDYVSLVKQVKDLLKPIGFRRNFETEFYEDDTKTFRKVMRFYFTH